MERLLARVLMILAPVILTLAACETTPTQPTPPPTTTDTFSGTLDARGEATHPFTVGVSGFVDITLANLAPLDTPAIGMAVGLWDGSVCTRVASNDRAVLGTRIRGTAAAGRFCVSVYDVGNLVDPIAYTLTVEHP